MSTECSICLEPYKDAVSIPCGHIFCSACLQSYIARESLDAVNAKCPMCQKDFSFLTPDLTLVMKPLHKHINPSIRRVYVNVNTRRIDKLKAELAAANALVKKLQETEKRTLKALDEEKQTSNRLKRELDTVRGTKRTSTEAGPLTAKRQRNSFSINLPLLPPDHVKLYQDMTEL